PWIGTAGQIGTMRFLAEIGRAEETREAYDRIAAKNFETVPLNEVYLSSLTGLAMTAYALRDRKGGAQLYTPLRPFTGRVSRNALYVIDGTTSSAMGLLAALGARGVVSVLVEGGAELLGALFDERLVDKVVAFIAPVVIGGTEAPSAVGGRGPERLADALALRGVRYEPIDGDLMVVGYPERQAP
ncbi:MAG: dihydrofolate reductase family protein, partial [Chloroflexi bacterium]|nr:dihydrofolate reductase family protein [Chloroflexota bacterium]